MPRTINTRGNVAATSVGIQRARRTWRTLSRKDTAGYCSAGVRLAAAALWPPEGEPPPWLTAQRRDDMIRNWLWERKAPKPSERTIRRYFRERD